MDRFSMAASLVERARAHQLWIGDDHGDRYEDALLSSTITDEMQVVVKELLEHLRSALDYCALQIWEDAIGGGVKPRIYFPIAKAGANSADFASLMNRNMPGIVSASAATVALFQSFQEFHDPKNVWLPELATLVNQAKHDHLEIASFPNAILKISKDVEGRMLTAFAPGHAPKRGVPWMLLKANADNLEGEHEAVFLQLKPIQVELNIFLKEAVPGVDAIVQKCRAITP